MPQVNGAVSWTRYPSPFSDVWNWFPCTATTKQRCCEIPHKETSLIWTQIIRTNIKDENNAGNRLGAVPLETNLSMAQELSLKLVYTNSLFSSSVYCKDQWSIVRISAWLYVVLSHARNVYLCLTFLSPRAAGSGLYCDTSIDGIGTCWPRSGAGQMVSRPCPEMFYGVRYNTTSKSPQTLSTSQQNQKQYIKKK